MPDDFVFGQQPETIAAWRGIARRNRAGVRTLLNGSHPLEAWSAAGFAVECALKAAVMAHLRFNRFPTREERPDLYTHDLMYLARQAGIDFAALVRDPVAPSFQTVPLWRRTEGYNPKPMPMRVAQDMVTAAIGPDGVIVWLSRRYRLDIQKPAPSTYPPLRGLGLDPEGLLWAHDRTVRDFVLVLVTAQFDAVGPLELYRLLTHAYNASVTPQAVSPFVVQLHSPAQSIARELLKAYGWDLHADPDQPDPLGITTTIELNVGDLTVRPEWVYQLQARTVPPAERARRWRRFKGNVDALAA